MKNYILTIIIAGLMLALSAARWQTVTNTSHVYDLMNLHNENGEFLVSTWGGVLKISPGGNPNGSTPFNGFEEKQVWTTANGLASNDVRNIEYFPQSQSIWFGSAFDGISIVNPQGVQQLDTSLGLPSNNVKKIVEYGSEILVATTGGLAAYYYLEGVNFPLLLHQYTSQSTGGGLLANQIDAMVLAENNYLFLSTTAGVNFVHLDSLDVDSAWHRFETTPFPAGFENKLSVYEDKLLLATPSSAHLRSTDPWIPGWQSYGPAEGVRPYIIANACIDGMDRVWISYGEWDEDFQSLTTESDTLITCIWADGYAQHWAKLESGLGEKCVSKIIPGDPSGTVVYLCTWGDGVFSSPHVWAERSESDIVFWNQFVPNSIGFPKIRNIAVDEDHAAWFSSGNLNTFPLKKSALGSSRYLEGDWHNFTTANSPIHTDNIYTVAVDSHNRKWFGTYDVNDNSPEEWRNGVSIFDSANGAWKYLDRFGMRPWNEETQTWGGVIPGTGGLLGNTALHVSADKHGNMFVSCFDDGVTVLTPSDSLAGSFLVPNSANQRVIFSYHSGSQYFIGTFNDPGLRIWNDDSIPVTGGEHWMTPAPPELNNCEVYGVVTVESPYEGIQHWIAASNGLFMWDEYDWYKWDTSVKRFIYNTATSLWDNDLLYYADEERLYGSVRTTPTAILLDPFNRIWIGSLEHGLSMYDPQTERFTNYYQENSPLLSNYVSALGYQPTEGLLLIGTPEGLNTLSIGRTIKPETTLESLTIYPNPFRPDSGVAVQITNAPSDIMPRGNNQCRIFDASGALVAILEENAFSRFSWDGTNAKGQKCASGIYFVVVTDDKGNRRAGKIALLR